MFSDGDNEICLIVGLGNPDSKYLKTRHNAGFMIADSLLDSCRGREEKKIPGGILSTARFAGREIHILKPVTYMNLSGDAVKWFLEKKKMMPAKMLVIHDDIDILLGRIRICSGGGTAGHNGLESIIEKSGSADFARLRAGIGVQSAIDMPRREFVLSEFSGKEMEIFLRTVEMAVSAVKLVLKRGLSKAMNDFNGLDSDKFETNKKEN